MKIFYILHIKYSDFTLMYLFIQNYVYKFLAFCFVSTIIEYHLIIHYSKQQFSDKLFIKIILSRHKLNLCNFISFTQLADYLN